jgi:hypothetical protein
MNNKKIDPASFLVDHYMQVDKDIYTVIRLERLLLDTVYKQCAIYPTEAYYHTGWVRILVMINKLYLELIPELADNDAYKNGISWIASWILEILSLRQQLSAKHINAKLDELLEERELLLEYIESNSPI